MASSLPAPLYNSRVREVCGCLQIHYCCLSTGFPGLTLLFLFYVLCDSWHCRLINSCMEAYAKAPATL